MKSQEVGICLCGLLENCGDILDSGGKETKIIKDGAFKMINCTKFIRANFRGNMLLLLRTLDQLMNSFIKPIIPKEELLCNLRGNKEYAVRFIRTNFMPVFLGLNSKFCKNNVQTSVSLSEDEI